MGLAAEGACDRGWLARVEPPSATDPTRWGLDKLDQEGLDQR